MKIFDRSFDAVEKEMEMRFKRHMLLSSNVANSETPNFKARELDFADQVKKILDGNSSALNMTNPQHMDLARSERERVVIDPTATIGADGNSVDIDISMGKISANGRAYDSAASILSNKFRMLKSFIKK
jgi:flagellar basal-body rod protein FlgB